MEAQWVLSLPQAHAINTSGEETRKYTARHKLTFLFVAGPQHNVLGSLTRLFSGFFLGILLAHVGSSSPCLNNLPKRLATCSVRKAYSPRNNLPKALPFRNSKIPQSRSAKCAFRSGLSRPPI